MSLDDLRHVEALAIMRRLVEDPLDSVALAAAEVWLRDNRPPPDVYIRLDSSELRYQLDRAQQHARALARLVGARGHPRGRSVTPQVGPHSFVPLRRFFNRGRCRACYLHEFFHPVSGWVRARPWGDRTPSR